MIISLSHKMNLMHVIISVTTYTVVENKLTFSPPKQRTWGLTQQELSRNPYVKS